MRKESSWQGTALLFNIYLGILIFADQAMAEDGAQHTREPLQGTSSKPTTIGVACPWCRREALRLYSCSALPRE